MQREDVIGLEERREEELPIARPFGGPGLEVVEGRLRIAGRDAEALARTRGTPLYVFDGARLAAEAAAILLCPAEKEVSLLVPARSQE